jgi:protocatechuate 3,4-dioxygenase alpha subunit
MNDVPTASQTVGPFFSIGLSHLWVRKTAPSDATREHVTIRGRVLDGDGVGVPDAILEIWQRGENEGGASRFRRVATGEHGEFEFSATKPATARDTDGSVHAPHFVVMVFMRGLLRHLVSRIYMAGEAANADDAVLKAVPEARRETLLATPNETRDGEFVWDIRLQGAAETVFFET